MSELLLIRHGKTIQSESGYIFGDNDNSPLSFNGLADIRWRLAPIIHKIFYPDIILISKWMRTYQTALELFPEMENKIRIREGLNEIDKGFELLQPYPEWENIKVEEWEKRFNNKKSLERLNFVYPSGMTVNKYINSVIEEFKLILNEYSGQNICIIGHNGSIKSILLFILNISKRNYYKLRVNCGTYIKFNLNRVSNVNK